MIKTNKYSEIYVLLIKRNPLLLFNKRVFNDLLNKRGTCVKKQNPDKRNYNYIKRLDQCVKKDAENILKEHSEEFDFK